MIMIMTTTTVPSTREARRLLDNRTLLAHPNMQAFLKAIAAAEGGGYDFRYGAVRGRRNDPGASPTSRPIPAPAAADASPPPACTRSPGRPDAR